MLLLTGIPQRSAAVLSTPSGFQSECFPLLYHPHMCPFKEEILSTLPERAKQSVVVKLRKQKSWSWICRLASIVAVTCSSAEHACPTLCNCLDRAHAGNFLLSAPGLASPVAQLNSLFKWVLNCSWHFIFWLLAGSFPSQLLRDVGCC